MVERHVAGGAGHGQGRGAAVGDRQVAQHDVAGPDREGDAALGAEGEADLVRIARAGVVACPRGAQVGRRQADVDAAAAVVVVVGVLEHPDQAGPEVRPRLLAARIVDQRAAGLPGVVERHGNERLVGGPEVLDPRVGDQPQTRVDEGAVADAGRRRRSGQLEDLAAPPLLWVPASDPLPLDVGDDVEWPGDESSVEDGRRPGIRLDHDRFLRRAGQISREGGRGPVDRTGVQAQHVALAQPVHGRPQGPQRIVPAPAVVGIVPAGGIDEIDRHVASCRCPPPKPRPVLGQNYAGYGRPVPRRAQCRTDDDVRRWRPTRSTRRPRPTPGGPTRPASTHSTTTDEGAATEGRDPETSFLAAHPRDQ